MNFKKVQDASKATKFLKQIKDTAIKDGYFNEFSFADALDEGIPAEDILKECDVLLTSSTKNKLMEDISEHFSEAESLDDNIADYVNHQKLDPNEVVKYLDNTNSISDEAKYVILSQFGF